MDSRRQAKLLESIRDPGSVCGSFVGRRLLGLVPSAVLLPLLAVILILSAVKVWRHH